MSPLIQIKFGKFSEMRCYLREIGYNISEDIERRLCHGYQR